MSENVPYDALAHFYDAMFSVWGKDYFSEVSALRRIINLHGQKSANSLLDVGCGTGEHLRHLMPFYQVCGVDSSAEMLKVAQAKLPSIRFWNYDMTEFDLGTKFDVVVSLFGAIGYAGDDIGLTRAIRCMSNHLQINGQLLIEPWFTRDEFIDHQSETLFGDKGQIKACRMRSSTFDEHSCICHDHILFSDSGQVTYFASKHRLGLFSHQQYLRAFNRCGLNGNYDDYGISGRGLYWAVKE